MEVVACLAGRPRQNIDDLSRSATPLAHDLVWRDHAACVQPLCDSTIAEIESMMAPHASADDLGWQVMIVAAMDRQ
jgi:hypothetical protein